MLFRVRGLFPPTGHLVQTDVPSFRASNFRETPPVPSAESPYVWTAMARETESVTMDTVIRHHGYLHPSSVTMDTIYKINCNHGLKIVLSDVTINTIALPHL